ncbi:MAG: hypothetical protein ACPGQS_06780 [Bradymonadia bacterium]
MKSGNNSTNLVQLLVNIAMDTAHNRCELLRWCDQIAASTTDEHAPFFSYLEPDGSHLLYNPQTLELHVKKAGQKSVSDSITRNELDTLISEFLTLVGANVTDLTTLPKRLRRLLTWRGLRPSVDVSSTESVITSRHLFYRISWRRYFRPPSMIHQIKDSLLVTSSTDTHKLMLKTGRHRQTFEGYCLSDNDGRIFLLNEEQLSLLNTQDQTVWTRALDYDDLSSELVSTKDSVFILDRDMLIMLSLTDGKRLRTISDSVHTFQVEPEWVFTLTTETNITIRRTHLSSTDHRDQIETPGHLHAYHWTKTHLFAFIGAKDEERCDRLRLVSLKTFQHFDLNLPQCKHVCTKVHMDQAYILLSLLNETYLLTVNLQQAGHTLVPVPIREQLCGTIETDALMFIVTTRTHKMIALKLPTPAIAWSQSFFETPLEQLEQSVAQNEYLIVPGGHATLVDLKTGRSLGVIDDPLFENARPIRTLGREILMQDETGYVGYFEFRGFIGELEDKGD